MAYKELCYYLLLVLMQEEVKLVVAEELAGQKHEFLIFNNQVVGQGGFGVVKKAIRNDRPQEPLVVKIIPYQDDKKREKIEREVNIIKQLSPHENLVSVEPIKCYSASNYYIFMEYCPDGTLEDLIKSKNGHFTEQEVFQIFYDIMEGYRVLYQAKILHQDLKPENILIKSSRYKLTDFGFSILHEGFKHGNIREGTLPYMSLEKLIQKQYYASTKSDVYSIGIILFRLITGHHPYVLSKGKEYKQFLKELKSNPLCLRPHFSSRFSMKFQHFFDLVLAMICKEETARIDFDHIYSYIENEQLFEHIREKHRVEPKQVVNEYQRFVITAETQAIAIPFPVTEEEEEKYREGMAIKNQQKANQSNQENNKKLQKYIVSNRIIVYFFDRLTRRVYIQKIKHHVKTEEEALISEKVILTLLLLCKKITQNLLKECKFGQIFPLAAWKIYRKQNSNLLLMIQRDENYLEDLVIDCLSESSQTRIKERTVILDRSRAVLPQYTQYVKSVLLELAEEKISLIKPQKKQSLITICYILSGLDIVTHYQKWEQEALELENYFRRVQTDDCKTLFSRVMQELADKDMHFTIELESGE